MENVKNCKTCGLVFSHKEDLLCRKCSGEVDKSSSYQKVRNYVYYNEGATVMETSEATGVESSLILQYIREGKISIMDKRTLLPRCEICEDIIEFGRVCMSCSNKKRTENKNENNSYGNPRFENRKNTQFGRKR